MFRDVISGDVRKELKKFIQSGKIYHGRPLRFSEEIPLNKLFVVMPSWWDQYSGPDGTRVVDLKFYYKKGNGVPQWLVCDLRNKRWHWTEVPKGAPEPEHELMRYCSHTEFKRITGWMLSEVIYTPSVVHRPDLEFRQKNTLTVRQLGLDNPKKFPLFIKSNSAYAENSNNGSTQTQDHQEVPNNPVFQGKIELKEDSPVVIGNGLGSEDSPASANVPKSVLRRSGSSAKIVDEANEHSYSKRRKCTMTTLKKVLFGVTGVTLLGLVLFGTSLWSYISTATGNVQEAVQDQIPISFQIDRASGLIEDLKPTIKKNMRKIANEEANLEACGDRIVTLDTQLGKAKEQLAILRDDLGEGSEVYVYCNRRYTRSQVQTDLSNRLEKCQQVESLLDGEHRTRDLLNKSITTARSQLQAMLAERRRLRVQVQQFRTRSDMIELAKTTSANSFDQGNLGAAKEAVANLNARITVEEKLVGTAAEMTHEVILDDADIDSRPISEKVNEYLATGPDAATVAVQE